MTVVLLFQFNCNILSVVDMIMFSAVIVTTTAIIMFISN